MIRFAADENFTWHVVRGVRNQAATADILCVQEADMHGASDEEVLEWAAREGRVLLSHDVKTMKAKAEVRVRAGLPMCGLVLSRQDLPINQCIDDIIDIHTYEEPEMWDYRIEFFPLT